jgi:hypothetical protein
LSLRSHHEDREAEKGEQRCAHAPNFWFVGNTEVTQPSVDRRLAVGQTSG